MDSTTEQGLRQLVRERLKKQVPEIERSLRQIAAGNPLGSEPRIERSVARITTKANLPKRDAEAFATAVRQKAALIESGASSLDGAEALQGPSMAVPGSPTISFCVELKLQPWGAFDPDPKIGEGALWALGYCQPDSIEPLIELNVSHTISH